MLKKGPDDVGALVLNLVIEGCLRCHLNRSRSIATRDKRFAIIAELHDDRIAGRAEACAAEALNDVLRAIASGGRGDGRVGERCAAVFSGGAGCAADSGERGLPWKFA